jgi:hypothetical protein
MATIVFMPFHWASDLNPPFALARCCATAVTGVRQTFNIELPVRVFVQVARPCRQRRDNYPNFGAAMKACLRLPSCRPIPRDSRRVRWNELTENV